MVGQFSTCHVSDCVASVCFQRRTGNCFLNVQPVIYFEARWFALASSPAAATSTAGTTTASASEPQSILLLQADVIWTVQMNISLSSLRAMSHISRFRFLLVVCPKHLLQVWLGHISPVDFPYLCYCLLLTLCIANEVYFKLQRSMLVSESAQECQVCACAFDFRQFFVLFRRLDALHLKCFTFNWQSAASVYSAHTHSGALWHLDSVTLLTV